MNKNTIIKISIISVLLLTVILTSSFFSNIFTTEKVTITKEEYKQLQRFKEINEIFNTIQSNYYIEPDTKKMLEDAARGMLKSLDDPYSFYYSPEEFAKYWEEDKGEYAGIGIQLLGNMEDLSCRVIRVFKNSPAEAAGIKKGDILTKAGNIDVDINTLNEAVDFIRGKIGSFVDITMKRGEKSMNFKVMRDKIHINWIENKMLDNEVGLIQLYEFSGNSGEEFKAAFDSLKSQGMKGLIMDLRDNPGGWVNNAVGIGNLFIKKDTLCYFEFRDGSRQYIKTQDTNPITNFPIVILVNENSASASELLSGAFQDYGLATIVGVKTYGKGVAQDIMGIGDKNAGMQYTSAQYFTPKGNKVHKVGIMPDIEVKLPEGEVIDYDFGDLNDIQLQKALETTKDKMAKVIKK